MSHLLTLDKPPHARIRRLGTPRGVFTMLDVEPDGHTRHRGIALLVPGFMGSKEDFLPMLSSLGRGGYRVLAVDGRGQHETGPASPDPRYGKGDLTRDLVAVVRQLDAGPVHLLGHSYGGLVARAAVIETAGDRSLWASLTLMNFGPGAVSAEQQERLRLLLAGLDAMTLEEIWPFVDDQDADTPPHVREFMRRRWLKNIPEHLAAAAEQMLNEPDLTAQLSTLDIEKAVISGSPDATWPPPAVEEMSHRLGARLIRLPGGGHSPNVHRPDKAATALLDFWDRTDGRGTP
ncbi:alpha/beta fold hydrolase [Actinacidiphila glaucinigra]|uniref:alpha/beta fold hydrolase n=1 Tax=Actinacidiphila glaucinigra TaxID=235986 RepID=UPI00366C424F